MKREESLRLYNELVNRCKDNVEAGLKELFDKIVEPEPEEKFITVTNGWRGGLKLKECWVRDDKDNRWLVIENVELLARRDTSELPFKILRSDTGDMRQDWKHLKFRPFSLEGETPSVDWPVELDSCGIFHFAQFEIDGDVSVYYDGTTSLSKATDDICDYSDFKFLNIEEVTD